MSSTIQISDMPKLGNINCGSSYCACKSISFRGSLRKEAEKILGIGKDFA